MLQNCRYATKHYVVSCATAFEAALESQRWRLRPGNWSTVRLSSGISANILDFAIPQKRVLRACGCGNPPQDGVGRGPNQTAARVSRPKSGRKPMAVTAASRPAPVSGSETMKFEIMAAANPVSETDRAAKLVDPGF